MAAFIYQLNFKRDILGFQADKSSMHLKVLHFWYIYIISWKHSVLIALPMLCIACFELFPDDTCFAQRHFS
jgi:hypothetical protein